MEQLVLEDTPPPDGSAMPEPPQPVPFDWQLMKPIVQQLNKPDPAWWGCLPTIGAPTLIVGGGPTSHVPQDKLVAVARLIPDCRLVTIDGAGHHVHDTQLDAFLAEVLPFLSS